MKWINKGHEFDEAGDSLKLVKKICIYGAGKLGDEVLYFLARFHNNYEISFIDADKKKQKSGKSGIPVLSPEEFLKKPKDKQIVVVAATMENTTIIMEKLYKIGYTGGVDCFTQQQFLSIYFAYIRDEVYMPSVSFLPSTICNLNCEACLNFNPYNKNQQDESLEVLQADIDIFFKCVDYIGLFHISGGEPFLYPYLSELIVYINNNYRDQIYILEVTTNGTVMPSDTLCKTLKEYNIHVILDDYREALSKQELFTEIEEKMKNYSINYTLNKAESWIDLCPLTTNHDDWSEEELIGFYNNCKNPFQELRNKRLYSCNYASYAMKAGLNIDSCNDYYDLSTFTDDKKKELIEFRLGYTDQGYVDFCKNCSGLSSVINKNVVKAARQAPWK